jgi:S1-C subfamily serine protease
MEMINLTGQRGVPVITVDGQVVIGFDRGRLEQLLNSEGGAGRVSLGITVADASKMIRELPPRPVSGAYVGAVKPGSAGEKAGLKSGDIITEVNNYTVTSAHDLESFLANVSSGEKINVTYKRGEAISKTGITL